MKAHRIVAAVIAAGIAMPLAFAPVAVAAPPPCGDVQVIWARGAGQPLNDTPLANFYERDLTGPDGRISPEVTVSLYELGNPGFGGFAYPAAAGAWEFLTAGADWAPYNQSVDEGAHELDAYLSDRTANCPDERYVLGGHSEGAQVISDGLAILPQEIRNKIAYTAVFGDPTWDNGPYPFLNPFDTACIQGPHQWVRGSAPCWAGPGILGLTKDPYVAADSEQRVGSWCRDGDGICTGAPLFILTNGEAHGAYFDDGAESAMAAREAAEALKIFVPAKAADFDASWDQFVFGAQGADLAIVFDTTGSMGGVIDDAKAQASELAQTWLDFFKNGRVGLVEFKDEGDPFVARIDAPLSSDVTAFQNAMNGLTASGGGDTPEAQLSGIMEALNGLDWADGATKVTIVITDAPGKDPEPGTGYTREQVSQRALEIDPVAVYGVDVANSSTVSGFMQPLADATAGQVFVLQSGQTLSDALFDVLDAAHSAPVAKLAGPYIAETGTAITLSARDSFDASSTITGYEWDFDNDGTTDRTTTTPDTAFTYSAAYDGLASVRVVASDGLSAVATANVTVDGEGLAGRAPLPPVSASAVATGPSEVTVEWTPADNDRADGYIVTLDGGPLVGVKLATDAHSLVVQDLDVTQPITLSISSANGFGRSASVSATTSNDAAIVTERVSESSSHGQGNGVSDDSYMSADGRYVTFRSTATNLVDGDTNGAMDCFVRDRLTDTTVRVSTGASGEEGNADSDDPAFSADGRYVTFRSKASNFVANDTNGSSWDIFVKDLQTGAIERVSVSSSGAQANNRSSDPAISADGRYVVFSSLASNLVSGDTNGIEDVFLRDRTAGTTIRISVGPGGVQGNGVSDDPILSDDGRYLAYQSLASNLVAGDTNAVRDIFLYDRVTGTTIRVSVSSSGAEADGDNNDPTISGDGSTVAWESAATNLVSGDTNARQDVFRRVLATGVTTRVSVTNSDGQGTGRSSDPSLSHDGAIVAFSSSSASLVSGDTNRKDDIFVRDTVAGTTIRVSVASDGTEANNTSDNPSASGDAQTVAFHSDASNLVPDDTNNAPDVFVRGPAL